MALLSLGQHLFEVEGLNFNEISRSLKASVASISRLGGRPAKQFTGIDDETITIKGLIFNEVEGGRSSYEAVKADLIKGLPLLLCGSAAAGTGRVFGLVFITGIDDEASHFGPDGYGRKVSFSIELTAAPERLGGGLF
jgi:uncharacterized protein